MKLRQTGYTLLEVLIATSILGTLTVLTAQSIQQALKSKTKIQHNLDQFAQIRDALHLMKRDINLAFHYRDLTVEINKAATPTDQTQASSPTAGFLPYGATSSEIPPVDATTHFIGDKDKMSFVTLNNARTYRNLKEADYIEVGYYIERCTNTEDPQKTSKCLWRRAAPLVDEDVEKGGKAIPLLERVKEFELRYFGEGKQDWVEEWRSDERGDAATKGNYPETVEISITVAEDFEPKSRTDSLHLVVPIHFPNNQTKATDNATSKTLPKTN